MPQRDAPQTLEDLMQRRFGFTLGSDWRNMPGSWTKRVTGLDLSKKGGFAVLGPFVRAEVDAPQDGLFLDCNRGQQETLLYFDRATRTRKTVVEPRKTFHLFRVTNGTLTLLHSTSSRTWLEEVAPRIQEVLSTNAAAPNLVPGRPAEVFPGGVYYPAVQTASTVPPGGRFFDLEDEEETPPLEAAPLFPFLHDMTAAELRSLMTEAARLLERMD